MKGYRLSTYTGKYYDRSREQYRICVIQRESGGNYDEPRPVARGLPVQRQPGGRSPSGHAGRDHRGLRQCRQAGHRCSRGHLDLHLARFFQDAAFWTPSTRVQAPAIGRAAIGTATRRGTPRAAGPTPIAGTTRRWSATSRARTSPARRSPARTSLARTGPQGHRSGDSREQPAPGASFIRERYGWKYPEFRALKAMWWRESNWRHDVINNHPMDRGTAWAGQRRVYRFSRLLHQGIHEVATCPDQGGTAYIKQRYGTPLKAWSFWQANGWY